MTLYHYTCGHGREALGDQGTLLPAAALTEIPMPWFASLVWLTDLDSPIRDALGLTSIFSACDRTEHRYQVSQEAELRIHRWVEYARTLPAGYREELESAEGARPAHWYVSTEPVPVVYDPIKPRR